MFDVDVFEFTPEEMFADCEDITIEGSDDSSSFSDPVLVIKLDGTYTLRSWKEGREVHANSREEVYKQFYM